MRAALQRRVDRLGRLDVPHFGVFCTAVLVVSCAYLTTRTTCWLHGERAHVGTVISFLPDAVVDSRALYWSLRAVFYATSLLWLAQRGVPWTSWASALSFTLSVAIFQEHLYYADHIFGVANLALIAHALWYQFYAADIVAARRAGRLWQTPLYPSWVHGLSLLCVGTFFTYAGVSKLVFAGADWANGVSLQLWLHIDARPVWLRDVVLADREVAIALQWLVLAVEIAAVLVIPFRRLRAIEGVGLVVFSFSLYWMFGWRFHIGGIVAALFYLPVRSLFPSVDQGNQTR